MGSTPTWTSAKTRCAQQLWTGGEIHANKNTVRPLTPRPAAGIPDNDHLGTQRLNFVIHNTSHNPCVDVWYLFSSSGLSLWGEAMTSNALILIRFSVLQQLWWNRAAGCNKVSPFPFNISPFRRVLVQGYRSLKRLSTRDGYRSRGQL